MRCPALLIAGLIVGVLSCCDGLLEAVAAEPGDPSRPAEFRRNEAFAYLLEQRENFKFTEQQRQTVAELLRGFFGTPDKPSLPMIGEVDLGSLLGPSLVKLAAGPAGTDAQGNSSGLYRQHCAECHGISGDGSGPKSSELNPYPRDFRRGWFKFKSTPLGIRPRDEDLQRIVRQGIPGTAMPAFGKLPDKEVEALVQYVKYLSIRGEIERLLLSATVEQGGAPLVPILGKNASPEQVQAYEQDLEHVKDIVVIVISSWRPPDRDAFQAPAQPAMTEDELAESRKRGHALFHGRIANCAVCHDEGGRAEKTPRDYDRWTREFIEIPIDPAAMNAFVAKGLPKPRPSIPLDLRLGVYRGGSRPIDLFWRIRWGIEGSTMPAVVMKPPQYPDNRGLTVDDIWDLVNYVQSLPAETGDTPKR